MSYCDTCDTSADRLELEQREHEVTKGYRQHAEIELAECKAGLAAAQTRVQELEGISRDLAEQTWRAAAAMGRARGHLEGLLWGVRAALAVAPPGLREIADLQKQVERIESLQRGDQ